MRQASKIDCITRSAGEISEVGGSDGEGRRWKLGIAEVIRAIEQGEMTCYVNLERQSHLVMVVIDDSGRKTLRSFVGDSLLRLPQCP